MITVSERDASRIVGAIEFTDSCWLWRRFLTRGYGHVSVGSKVYPAHRLVYQWLAGDIPEGLQLDHLCRVRHCVNPEHLEPVPQRVNILRGVGASAKNAAATHCRKGHEYAGGNLYVSPRGWRWCRQCLSEWASRAEPCECGATVSNRNRARHRRENCRIG